MKLLTLNTHSWMEEDMEAKFSALVERIMVEDYEVICLQEVNQSLTSQPVSQPLYYHPVEGNPVVHEDNYALKLVKALAARGKRYNWSWAYNHVGYDRFHEGVAILAQASMEPLAILASSTTSPEDYHTRRALLVRTQLGNQAFSVVSLHLSWWEKGFQDEWPRLAQVLASEEHPLIVMGDFNNPTGNPGYQEVINSSLNLVDSHKVADEISGEYTIVADIDGWEGNDMALKVDHAFVDRTFQVKRSQVVFDGKSSPTVSDHFGLEVILES